MALPPRSVGTRVRRVRIEAVEQRFRVTVGARRLPATFASASEARDAAAAEAVRLDAVALALLRRIRSRSGRKQG